MNNEIQAIKELKYNAVKESENTTSQYSRNQKLHFYVIYPDEYNIPSRNKSMNLGKSLLVLQYITFFFFLYIYKTIKADQAEKTNEVASLKITW